MVTIGISHSEYHYHSEFRESGNIIDVIYLAPGQKMHPEQQRVKQLLTEAITLLCRNNLQFREDVTVEGLLGITLDKSDVFLVSIHETIQCVLKGGAVEVRAEKRNVSNHEDGHTPRKRCRRRQGSREGSSSPPLYHSNQIDPKPDTSTKISECINVKLEETDDDHQFGQPSEECVKLSLVHDSTHKLPSDDNATIEKQQDLPGGYVEDACDAGEVQVKQEVQEQEVEEEKRPVVYIDRHDVTDTSHSLPPHGIYVGLYDWASPGDDQSGFSLSELDTISTANSKQQVSNTCFRPLPTELVRICNRMENQSVTMQRYQQFNLGWKPMFAEWTTHHQLSGSYWEQ